MLYLFDDPSDKVHCISLIVNFVNFSVHAIVLVGVINLFANDTITGWAGAALHYAKAAVVLLSLIYHQPLYDCCLAAMIVNRYLQGEDMTTDKATYGLSVAKTFRALAFG